MTVRRGVARRLGLRKPQQQWVVITITPTVPGGFADRFMRMVRNGTIQLGGRS